MKATIFYLILFNGVKGLFWFVYFSPKQCGVCYIWNMNARNEVIYLADDHIIVANALSSLLLSIDPTLSIRTFSNGKELYDASVLQQPDLVLLDIEMPVWDGRKTLSEITQRFPGLPCLILSMNSEKSIIQDCINNGAKAYILKDATMAEFKEALEQVRAGKIYFSLEILKVPSEKSNPVETPKQSVEHIPLSARELEILKLICEGLSPKEIGETLFLSHRTVETHKKNIMDKLEVNSVSKLIVTAIKNNIITS